MWWPKVYINNSQFGQYLSGHILRHIALPRPLKDQWLQLLLNLTLAIKLKSESLKEKVQTNFHAPNPCNEHLPERHSISVPPRLVNICRIAIQLSFHLLEQHSGAFQLHYTTVARHFLDHQFLDLHFLDFHFLDHQNLAVYCCLPGLTDLGPSVPGPTPPGSVNEVNFNCNWNCEITWKFKSVNSNLTVTEKFLITVTITEKIQRVN